MGAGENGARERDTRGERERQPERPMKIVSRPLSSLHSMRFEVTNPSACCRLQNLACLAWRFFQEHYWGEAAKTRAKSARTPLGSSALPHPPTKTTMLRRLTKLGSNDADWKNIFLVRSPGLKFTTFFLSSRNMYSSILLIPFLLVWHGESDIKQLSYWNQSEDIFSRFFRRFVWQMFTKTLTRAKTIPLATQANWTWAKRVRRESWLALRFETCLQFACLSNKNKKKQRTGNSLNV